MAWPLLPQAFKRITESVDRFRTRVCLHNHLCRQLKMRLMAVKTDIADLGLHTLYGF